MNLSRIDLKRFTVLDAIYRERRITAASKRLQFSQPAVSPGQTNQRRPPDALSF
jgi:hypothetical protein